MTADAKPWLPSNAVRWIQDQRGIIRHAALWITTARLSRSTCLPSLAISVPGKLCQDFVHLIVNEFLALNPVRAARQRVRKLIAQLHHVKLRISPRSWASPARGGTGKKTKDLSVHFCLPTAIRSPSVVSFLPRLNQLIRRARNHRAVAIACSAASRNAAAKPVSTVSRIPKLGFTSTAFSSSITTEKPGWPSMRVPSRSR